MQRNLSTGISGKKWPMGRSGNGSYRATYSQGSGFCAAQKTSAATLVKAEMASCAKTVKFLFVANVGTA